MSRNIAPFAGPWSVWDRGGFASRPGRLGRVDDGGAVGWVLLRALGRLEP